MFYFPDRSMSMQRTLAYLVLAIAALVVLTFVMGKWTILAGAIWFLGRLFSPNMMERAVSLALLIAVLIAAKLFL